MRIYCNLCDKVQPAQVDDCKDVRTGELYQDIVCGECGLVITSGTGIKPLTGWQPIETAPEETEVFIGAFIDGVFKFGRSQLFYEQGNAFEGETWSGWVWSIDDCDDSVAENPTHWMPLPAAPQRIAGGQA